MANEAASVAAEEAPSASTESALADPPQPPKSDPAQKAVKETAKLQTPITSVETNKGKYCQNSTRFFFFTLFLCNVTDAKMRERTKVKIIHLVILTLFNDKQLLEYEHSFRSLAFHLAL